MIRRFVAALIVSVGIASSAVAQERVTVVTQRLADNGALFIAAVRGYFKAEGIDIQMGAYRTPQEVLEAVAAGRSEFGLTALSSAAFNLAGRGVVKIVAGQLREMRSYEGDQVVASNAAYDKGLRKFEDLAGKVIAVDSRGTSLHYQLGQIARVKGFDLDGVTVKALAPLDNMAKAVAAGQVDAAILPAAYARELVIANEAKLVGWYSDVDEQQTGALFAATKTIETRPTIVEKFVRAYARGVADYAKALLRHDRYGKRISDSASQAAAGVIARYVYPDRPSEKATIETNAYFMDPKARIDIADIERQLDWYKAQGFVDKAVGTSDVVDARFAASP
jgi:NitT/TauT family transport system substrate-binding protein